MSSSSYTAAPAFSHADEEPPTVRYFKACGRWGIHAAHAVVRPVAVRATYMEARSKRQAGQLNTRENEAVDDVDGWQPFITMGMALPCHYWFSQWLLKNFKPLTKKNPTEFAIPLIDKKQAAVILGLVVPLTFIYVSACGLWRRKLGDIFFVPKGMLASTSIGVMELREDYRKRAPRDYERLRRMCDPYYDPAAEADTE
ncbi:unnamed protein product [Vitrella brassicaformis CCMP3155]|uniref:Uncharacterized protein n=1 Tax=Vitrella brassicaformis (strain CCMP3155) TaxID=1169540 RepID=A0A0G4EXH0_VITBC|nr:unnamed protein product [Vitrella brassicaformis CCMP3155]|mmetsp:Transcript_51844/g.130223  ORF Transcript_51844/g.130223 Transcript_51844/m.130223 type:complete len:199 (+) Transcript_51844:246-842(+)|eukprot:CEM03391.1 unnamed protein product [Vitrella brassicaformis CCMP3155]